MSPPCSSSNNNNNNNTTTNRSESYNCPSDHSSLLSEPVIKCIFLLLGIGILLPWNAFVNAKPYFQSRFCSTTTTGDHDGQNGGDGEDEDDNGIIKHPNFEQWFGVIWNIASVVSLGSIIIFNLLRDKTKFQSQSVDHVAEELSSSSSSSRHDNGNIIENGGATLREALTSSPINELCNDGRNCSSSNNHTSRSNNTHTNHNDNTHEEGHSFILVMIPLSLYLVVFLIMDILVFIPNISSELFFNITLIGLGICGMCQAIATSGVVATAGLFPPTLGIGPFFSGQALGGVVVAITNFITATIEDPTNYYNEQCTNSGNDDGGGNGNYSLSRWLEDNNDYNNGNYYDIDQEWQISIDMDLSSSSSATSTSTAMTCTTYDEIDWVVFVYFGLGCVVLAICLVGYSFINKYQKFEHRNDYETVQNIIVIDKNDNNSSSHNNHNHNINITQEDHGSGTPRIGLELHDRIHDRQKQQQLVGEQDSFNRPYRDHDPLSTRSAPSSPTTSPMDGTGRNSAPHSELVMSSLEEQRLHHQQQQDDQFHDETTSQAEAVVVVDDSNLTAAVWSAVKGPACCVYLTFLVTLTLFPGWISELRSTHQCENHHWRLSNDLYTPFTFLVFNVGDLTGRLLSSKIPLPTSTATHPSSPSRKNMSMKLVVGALLRGIFFLLFLLCVTSNDVPIGDDSSNNSQTHHSLLLFKIHSDFYSLVVQFAFALTNGLLISYSFMYASNQVQHTTDMQERSSEMLTFSIGFGLLSGSLLSFPFTNLATSRW